MTTAPRFDLARLFRTVFRPEPGERVAVFTDLPDPREVVGLRFLDQPGRSIQTHAWRTLAGGLRERAEDLGIAALDFYAYEETGGSNLELPETALSPEGEPISMNYAFERHTIVIFMGRYSATAPATALAKKLGIRGATMHGVNDLVFETGLAQDYEQVSARAERLRSALTRADGMRLEWTVALPDGGGPRAAALEVALGRQEAQKSHGLVRGPGDVANLPAGEVYYVPTGAEGVLPRQFEDAAETIALFDVRGGRIAGLAELVRGDRATVDRLLATIAEDPAVAAITELGLGTQTLPFAGTDIQDEKILGTAHLATGRSDHLGGDIGPKSFRLARNASHNDILYSPTKTPAVELTRVTMRKDGRETVILERYRPAPVLEALL